MVHPAIELAGELLAEFFTKSKRKRLSEREKHRWLAKAGRNIKDLKELAAMQKAIKASQPRKGRTDGADLDYLNKDGVLSWRRED